jgi:hypothetical protein
LWSFSKGPRREKRLQNLARVPKLLGTLQELQVPGGESAAQVQQRLDRRSKHGDSSLHHGSLSSLTSRAPDLRLGIGLPMSRLYAGKFADNSGVMQLTSLQNTGLAVLRSTASKAMVSMHSFRFRSSVTRTNDSLPGPPWTPYRRCACCRAVVKQAHPARNSVLVGTSAVACERFPCPRLPAKTFVRMAQPFV